MCFDPRHKQTDIRTEAEVQSYRLIADDFFGIFMTFRLRPNKGSAAGEWSWTDIGKSVVVEPHTEGQRKVGFWKHSG